MKKLFILALCALSVVSCEREIENVEKNETFEKPIKTRHDQNSSKSASDTLSVPNISPDAGIQITIPTEPIEEVDPKDIKTPPRNP